MVQEIRFTDPAFTCEVVLSGTTKGLYEAAKPQFDRLKRIKNLGIAAHISETASHMRHQHLVGLLRIFNKLCLQSKGKGLPKQFLWSFWCRLCFGQTGHAAFSYDSEKAVLLACHTDQNFKAKFRALLQPVIDYIKPCLVCTKPCNAKGMDSSAAALWFEELVQQNEWQRIHLWIAALKLIQDTKIIGILKQQKANQGNLLGFSEPEAFKMLVSSECGWQKAFSRLNRLDYVVRDLAFAGTLGIQVDVDGLITAADQKYNDWVLLEHLSQYLTETLYENIQAQTSSILYQRILADLLIKDKLSLEELFGIDTDSAIDDDQLARVLKKVKAGREIFDSELCCRRYSKVTRSGYSLSPSFLTVLLAFYSRCDIFALLQIL